MKKENLLLAIIILLVSVAGFIAGNISKMIQVVLL